MPEHTTLDLDDLQEAFFDEVFSKSAQIDPDDSYHWDSLAFGWALAKGASIDLAHALSMNWSTVFE